MGEVEVAPSPPRLERLADGWVYGGILLVPVLLALMPFLFQGAPNRTALLLVFAALPVYMIHQFEEHDGDRFHRFVLVLMRPNHAGLTRVDILVINVVLVWCVLTLSVVLAATVGPGWGLLSAYAIAVNAAVHLAPAVAMRRANPGLVTAGVLFLPLAAAIFVRLPGTLAQHAVSAGVVLALHGTIIARALRRAQAAAAAEPKASAPPGQASAARWPVSTR